MCLVDLHQTDDASACTLTLFVRISFASKNRKNHLNAPPARRTRHSAPRQTHAQHPTDLWDDLAWTRAVAGAAPVRARAYNPLPVLMLIFSTCASKRPDGLLDREGRSFVEKVLKCEIQFVRSLKKRSTAFIGSCCENRKRRARTSWTA